MVMKASTKPKVKTGNIVIALREKDKVENRVVNISKLERNNMYVQFVSI